jgi:hypothetical protein
MSEQENGTAEGPDEERELRERARERVERMPAETALGNADPAGGGEGDPKDFPPEGNETS